MTCDYTGLYFIDQYICLASKHPYVSILLLGLISVIVIIVWFVKTQMPREDDDGKLSWLGAFFDALKGMGK